MHVSDFFDPMDCSPSGSSVHGISQARILEWGVWGSSPPRDRTQVSLSLCVPFSFTLSLLVLLFYFFIPFSHFFYFISPFSSSCFLLDLAFSIYFPQKTLSFHFLFIFFLFGGAAVFLSFSLSSQLLFLNFSFYSIPLIPCAFFLFLNLFSFSLPLPLSLFISIFYFFFFCYLNFFLVF